MVSFQNFPCHYARSSEFMDRAFLTLLPQWKYAIPDNPNNIGFTFSSTNELLHVRQKRNFIIRLKTHKTYKKLLKSFVKVCSYNDCAIHRLYYVFCINLPIKLIIKALIAFSSNYYFYSKFFLMILLILLLLLLLLLFFAILFYETFQQFLLHEYH